MIFLTFSRDSNYYQPELEAFRLYEQDLLPRLHSRYPKGMSIEQVLGQLQTDPRGFDQEILGSLSAPQMNMVKTMMLQLINDVLFHFAIHVKKQMYEVALSQGIALGELPDEEARNIFNAYWSDYVRTARLQ